MLFSIIIPTYNPRQYLPRLLESISHNECLNEIEVIISDDLSSEFFDDIIYNYSLNIKVIYNDKHQGFPRAGRQHGADVANGKWITFIDQDDGFVDNAFDKVKQYIQDNNVTNYLISHFIVEDNDTYTIQDGTLGWTHGKFFEKVFWEQHKLCYDDVQYCEDVDLITKMECLTYIESLPTFIMNEPIYVWNQHKDSLADLSYYINSMPDYVRSSLGVIMNYLKQNKDNEQLQFHFILTLADIYFYLQGDAFINQDLIVKKTINIVKQLYEQFKQLYFYTNQDIINVVSTTLLEKYNKARAVAGEQIPFIEQITFKEWLNKF